MVESLNSNIRSALGAVASWNLNDFRATTKNELGLVFYSKMEMQMLCVPPKRMLVGSLCCRECTTLDATSAKMNKRSRTGVFLFDAIYRD